MIGLALVGLALAVFLYGAYRRGQLVRAAVAVVMVAAVAFGVSVLAVASNFRDADGFMDCWPYCSLLQEAVGAGLFLAPPVAVIGLVALVAAAVARRSRTS